MSGSVPLLVNMVEGGDTPLTSAAELERLGFAIVIFPGAMVRALTFQALQFLEALHRDGDTHAFAGRMLDFAELQALLGTEEILERGRRWDRASSDSTTAQQTLTADSRATR